MENTRRSRAAGGLAAGVDPLAALTERLRTTFSLSAASVLVSEGDGTWRVDASSGHPAPLSPASATATVPIDDRAVLALRGGDLTADDRRVLEAFAAQLGTALERRELQAQAAGAAVADAFRMALLRAVSHDLRTPLSSIKASVSSLRQDDVDWSPAETGEFLAMIEEETDRLDRVVGNLLDMGRLQAGVVAVARRPVALEEVLPIAVGTQAAGLDLAINERSPRVIADPHLLERALANVVSNALAWNSGPPVRVEAWGRDGVVDIRVIDHGPGVPFGDRGQLFEPFQRLGDRSNDTGVGLGLAVTRGFMQAMGGEVGVSDTPGGGLTMVLTLPRAPA